MKIAIITISKNNEKYLDEWITYHRDIGVDKIFFLDNNTVENDSQYNIIKKYNICEWINLRGKTTNSSSISSFQKTYFTELFNEYKSEYDWFLFIDVDEFLYTDMPVKTFLSQKCFENAVEILLNWKCFDDNNLCYYEAKPVQERFTRPYFNTTCYSQNFPENEICKCFLSNKAEIISHNIHTVTIKTGKIKNALGEEIKENWRQTPIIHKIAYIKHYETKTIEEYIECRILSKKCNKQEILNRIKWFFNVNTHTPEKDRIANFIKSHFK